MSPSAPPTMSPRRTAHTASNSVAREPQITRLSTSRPRPSPPRRWPSVPGPCLAIDATLASGSSRGSTGASSASATTKTSQEMATTPPMPRRPRRARRGASGAGPSTAATRSTGSSVAVGTSGGSTGAAGSGSGMADPRGEPGVEDVDEEVDEHVAHRDDRHQALQGDVLTRVDRLEQQRADAWQREDDLDDHG